MSKSPSVTSPGVSSALLANGHANLAPPSASKLLSPSPSPSPNVPGTDIQSNKFDPDEVFRKHTIADVKFIQSRLRVDADAKQEELRLMVGERYRDLLQASTSIISIAKSSQHVTQTLEEIEGLITAPRQPVIREDASTNEDDDAHLQVLQRLSAHLKLLLDAPEYLWRLIERKKYLQAAWLFLLARVVHRALVRDSDDEETSWISQDIDVLAQFPIIQRQWGAISQFRSQIVHKATHSLRDHNASVEDTCAAILTLHLLESRPLSEALSLFLSQRSKSLHTSLGWSSVDSAHSKKANGNARRRSIEEMSPMHLSQQTAGGIQEATHSSLNTILHTLQTARKIVYSNQETSQESLIQRVLVFIQSDAASTSDNGRSLSPELYLTTQTILAMLPSSAHFNLLPHDIKNYRPYIDLSSASSNIRPSQFSEKLNDWFRQSLSSLRPSIERWFNDLTTVKEVWGIRNSTQAWIRRASLDADEHDQIMVLLDKICQLRIVDIWNTALGESLRAFEEKLSSTVASLLDGAKRPTPSDSLFHPPALPSSLHIISTDLDNPFVEYKTNLRRQLLGRTSTLDEVLESLEDCASTIQQDFIHIKDTTTEMGDQLETGYRPYADQLCLTVTKKVHETEVSIQDSKTSARGLVFLAQLSEELASSSPFVRDIGCETSVANEFREKLLRHHHEIVDRWRELVIRQILEDFPNEYSQSESQKPSDPSSGLVHALLSLATALQEVGLPRSPGRRESLVGTTLRKFVLTFSEEWDEEPDAQYAYDLAFLYQILSIHGDDLNEAKNTIQGKFKASLPKGLSEGDVSTNASLSLARMQNLFAALLPQQSDIPSPQTKEKATPLLPLGVPTAEQQYQSTLILAKPSSRFGLLMVDGVQ